MSKSYVADLLEVYFNVFRDVLYAYPNLGSELEKDWQRLTRLTTQRGLPFLMVDLPALGKHLDRCLAEGQYKVSGLPGGSRVSGTVPIPKMFRGLYLLVFDEHGRLKQPIDFQALLFLRTLLSVCKKVPIQCSQDKVVQEVEQFVDTDCSLPEPQPFWSKATVQDSEYDAIGPFMGASPYSERALSSLDKKLLMNFDLMSRFISLTLGTYNPSEWDFRHGPGAVSNVASGVNRYRFTNWSDRLEREFPSSAFAFSSERIWAADTSEFAMTSLEESSKLIDVIKTLKKPRLIAAEPCENMWCQQNIRHYMYTRVEKSWIGRFIKFDDQTQNQDLCRRASCDGSLVTLDLSEASDRVSCRLVAHFFRVNRPLLGALQATRTRFVRQEQTNSRPALVELRKYSTMGNATTFPVESLVFLGAALAAALSVDPYLTVGRLESLIGRVSVFGDDIIVPEQYWCAVVRLLEILDFKVNASKSYTVGQFRESCGVDCFGGVDVTPPYYKGQYDGSPESYERAVEVSNNFYKKFFIHTAALVRSTTEGRFHSPLIDIDSGILGWCSFVRPSERHWTCHRSRWNRQLQRMEYLMPVVMTVQKRTPIRDNSALLQYFTESRSKPCTKWYRPVASPLLFTRELGVSSRPKLKLKLRWVPLGEL